LYILFTISPTTFIICNDRRQELLTKTGYLTIVWLFTIIAFTTETQAQVTFVPPQTTGRQPALEAMHDLFKAVAAFKRYLEAGDLLVIHNYDNTIRTTMTLYQNAELALGGKSEELKSTLLQLKLTIMTFHAAADASDQVRADREFVNVEQGMKKLRNLYPQIFSKKRRACLTDTSVPCMQISLE